MMLLNRRAMLTGAAVISLATPRRGSAAAPTVTIAYQDMVVPLRVLMAQGSIEQATGYKIIWRKFAAGGDVIRAMASGNVMIGEVGSSPLATALSQGLNLTLFAILDSIADAEQLVVRSGSAITTLPQLRGKKIATPFASTAHYQLMFALQKAGLTAGSVTILNMRPQEIEAAWSRGDIDAAFVWDPVLSRLRRSGSVLLSAGSIARQGCPTFDGLAVDQDWAKDNRDFLITLVRLMGRINSDYQTHRAAWTAKSAQARAIAQWTGADPQDVPAALAAYRFPTLAEQASATWLGGGAAKALQDTSVFLQAQGRIGALAADYAQHVSDAYVKAAMP